MFTPHCVLRSRCVCVRWFGFILSALVLGLVHFPAFAQSGCYPPPSGLIDWWPGNGTALDVQGGRNGTLVGGISFTNGEVGQAFKLDGVSGYVDLGSWTLGSTWTIEAWVNPASLPGGRYTFVGGVDNCYDWGIALSSGQFGVVSRPPGGCTQTTVAATPVVPGTWYHVAATCDGTNASIYVNGVFQGSAPVEPNYVGDATDVRIGSEVCCGAYFPGLIDEVSIYNRALSSNEIANIYAAGAAGKCTDELPPVFVKQPQGAVATLGGSAQFNVTLNGTPPLGWQWQQGGTNVPGATSPTLVLNNLTVAQAGGYALVVTNAFGSATSVVASLVVAYPLTLGTVVSNNVPFTGDGDLLQAGQVDTYQFNVASNLLLFFNPITMPSGGAGWTLTAPNGRTVFSGYVYSYDNNITVPEPGTYTLSIYGWNNETTTGPYSFQITQRPINHFNYTLGTIVSSNSPVSGEGNLAVDGQYDIYQFTVTSNLLLYFNPLTVPNGGMGWILTGSDGNTVFNTYASSGPVTVPAAGTYQLAVYGWNNSTTLGAYSFQITQREINHFDYTLGTVVSSNAPLAGEGNLTAAGQYDIYQFTAPTNLLLYFNPLLLPNGGAGWTLTGPNGVSVFSSYISGGPVLLPEAGTYQLAIYGWNNSLLTGAYSFQITERPINHFNYTLGTVVSSNSPVTGEGNLTSVGQYDLYQFTVTTNLFLYFNALGLPNGGAGWNLTGPNGVSVFSGYMGSGAITMPGPGTYELAIYGWNNDSTTGAYSFQITDRPLNYFNYTLGTVVSSNSPVVGEGNLVNQGQYDFYQFNVTTNLPLYFNVLAQPPGGSGWTLVGPNGYNIFGGYMESGAVTVPTAGTYVLEVYGWNGVSTTGAYSFQITDIPNKSFDITVGQSVSPNVPFAGAGILQSPGEHDFYSFEGVGGQIVSFIDNNASGYATWTLRAPGTGTLFSSQLTGGGANNVTLPATGTYTIDVAGGSGTPINYFFALANAGTNASYIPPNEQVIPVSLGTTVSNGVPVASAGVIATAGATEIYTFTVTNGQSIYLVDLGSSSGNLAYCRIYDPFGNELYGNWLNGGNNFEQTLGTSGTYTIAVNNNGGSATGTYAFSLLAVPPANAYNIGLGQVVTNGVPGAGAGVIAAIGASDTYMFTITNSQTVYLLDLGSSSGNLALYRIYDPYGNQLSDNWLNGGNNFEQTFAPGTYTITVNNNGGTATGTYSFELLGPAAPNTYSIALGQVVTNGVPGPGAGIIATPVTSDTYTFTVTNGQAIYLQDLGSSSGNLALYRIYDPYGNQLSDNWLNGGNNYSAVLGEGGTYTITVNNNGGTATGTYSFVVWSVPPPATYTLAIGQTVTTNVPGPGAGFLSAPGAVQTYDLTVTNGQTIYLQDLSGAAPYTGVLQIFDPYGDRIYYNWLNGGNNFQQTLGAGGTYTLVVNNNGGAATGGYSFVVWSVPPPAIYNIAFGQVVTNGVPAPGAGVISSPGAVQIYNFNVAAGQTIYLQDLSGFAPYTGVVQLFDPYGTRIYYNWLNGGNNFQQTLGGAGTYSIVVNNNGGPATGTYSFALESGNVTPIIAAIPPQFVNVMSWMTLSNLVSEPSIDTTLTYSLLVAPVGMTIDTNGVITWQPNILQGPSTNLVIFEATSTGDPGVINPVLSATNSFVVVVGNTNPAPVLTWNSPSPITYGTPLGTNQLDATASVPGDLAYDPPLGTVPDAGTETLSVLFTPSDLTHYRIVGTSVELVVNPAPLAVSAHNASRGYGQTNPVFTGTLGGVVNSDDISASYSSAATPLSAPGGYPIVPGLIDPQFRLDNYNVHSTNGTLTVTAGAPPTLTGITPASGVTNGGTAVTITGTGFELGAGVTFGTESASNVVVDSETQITAVSPPNSLGMTNVIVRNPDSNSATLTNAFTYTGSLPVFLAQPVSAGVVQGGIAAFSVNALYASGYQWQFNGANLANGGGVTGVTTPDLGITGVSAPDDGYYRCVVTNLYGSIISTSAVLTVIVPPSTVIVSPSSASVGAGGSTSFTATPSGTAPFSYAWYQNGTLLPSQTGSVLNLADVQANASYDVVVANAAGSVTSAPVNVTVLGYCTTGQATQATYPEGTQFIPINVSTFNCGSSAPSGNSPAVVWLTIDGTSRNLTVTTGASGTGTAYFTPLPVEVGLVQYGFGLPGQGQPAPVGSFTIIGMNLSAQSESPNLVIGITQTNTLLLNNLTAVPLSGITAAVIGAPPGVSVQVSVPSAVVGNGSIQTTYTVEATSSSLAEANFSIQYTSAQGATVTLPFTATVSPPTAQLTTMPASLVGTMVEGTQTLIPFTLYNFGGAASGPLQINLPAASWLSAVTAQPIPSLAPGQTCQIMLALTPTNGQPLGEYPGSFVIQGSSTALSVPFVFTSVSTLKGDLQVTAQDELSIYGAGNPNVSNATVTVTDFLTGTNVGTQMTGASGIVTFTNLTSAYYNVSVTAPDHGNFSTTYLVAANETNDLTAFLSLNLVDYTWTVIPTTIPDTYDYTLTTTFVTEVPWPVVTIGPAIDLCTLTNCTNQIDLTINNHGLIAAEGLQLVIQNSDPNWDFFTLVTNLGNLAAESSITVPISLNRVECQTNELVASAISANLTWYVAALNGTEYNSSPIFIYDGCATGAAGTPVGVIGGPAGGVITHPVVTQPVNYVPPPVPGADVAVTLQIDQTSVLTANAFHATLNLTNNAAAQISDLKVTINPVDANGNPATNAFFIQPPVVYNLGPLDGTGSLAVGAGGQANWTIIPTTNAAPVTNTAYAIGGSISYVLNGEPVTIPLFPVPITVLPSPQLYLDYFLQHDVYSQDPFTIVPEPPIPFALGLRVRNLGQGIADNFTITSAQPTIINNANGLLINFQIIDSVVGTNTTPVPSLTLDMGNIDPGTNVVGIWWMISSLEGDFTNFQATFQHLDSLGGLETSVVNSVKIHEMNHVVEITYPSDDGIPDFLCNDTTNVDALPDDVYSSDGNVYPVTSLTGAAASGSVSGGNSTVTVADELDTIPSGFVYFELPDPSDGQAAVTSIKRSDGTELLIGPNVWQTPYRPHMVPPQLNNLLHIFDYNSTGFYTVTYGPPVTAPSVTTLAAEDVTSSTAALSGVINPQSGNTEYYFQWGLTTNYDNFTATNSLTTSLGSAQAVMSYIIGLAPATTIHYELVAANSAGITHGGDETFITTTPPPPVITQVTNRATAVGQALVISNQVQVATPPAIFSLDSSDPEGATISTNGVFRWIPACLEGSSTNLITIWVADSSTPPLSNFMTFAVEVGECVQLELGSTALQVGTTSGVPVNLLSTVSLTNLSWAIANPAGRLTNWVFVSSNTAISSVSSSQTMFNVSTGPGQTLESPSLLGTLRFSALPGPSVFLPLVATNILGTETDGSQAGNIASVAGRVAVVGGQPLLEPTIGTNFTRTLILYDNPGTNFELMVNTSLTSTNWQIDASGTVTNLMEYFNVNPAAPLLFYRAQ